MFLFFRHQIPLGGLRACVLITYNLQIELEFPPVRGKLDISLGEVRVGKTDNGYT